MNIKKSIYQLLALSVFISLLMISCGGGDTSDAGGSSKNCELGVKKLGVDCYLGTSN